jgi:hypothetical protein
MEWKRMWKNFKMIIILRQQSPLLPMIDQIQPETVEYFGYLVGMAKVMQDVHGILNPVLP